MNVLFVVADALRSDRLHCCGNSHQTSPAMDRLAEEGVLFTNVIANSNHTLPGLVSMFTGLYLTSHGIRDQASFAQWSAKWDGRRTPFRVLAEQGYVVAGDDPDLYHPLGFGTNGRQVGHCLRDIYREKFLLWHRSEQTHLPFNPMPPYDTTFLPPDFEITESLADRLGVVKSNLIVHRPGLVSKLESGTPDAIEREGYERNAGTVEFAEAERPAILALYDGEVRTLDYEIEGYLRMLEVLGIADNTIVVVTSDHGEQLLERGAIGHSSCSLEGNLYDENIRIPLIIRCPSAIPAGKVIDTQISQVDIMPTLFDILGFEMPGPVDGRSARELIDNPRSDWAHEAYAQTPLCGWQALNDDHREIWCIRKPPYKLIKYLHSDGAYSCELFDLDDDPGEEKNIINDRPQIGSELKEKLDVWISTTRRATSSSDLNDPRNPRSKNGSL